MTPAIRAANKAKINFMVHKYAHDPASESYGKEAANKLGVAENRVFKTLVVSLDNKKFAVCIIPVSTILSMKRIAKAAGAKKATMAAQAEVERLTGYVIGGVSPLGQKQRLQTFIDSSAQGYSTIYVSAGRRGLEIELNPQDLSILTSALFVDLCP
jgi:Cys-tRNA(Pro)/Cys-tRNA(Cys) deacylase